MASQKRSNGKTDTAQSKAIIVALCAAIMISGGIVARMVKPDVSAHMTEEMPNALEPASGASSP